MESTVADTQSRKGNDAATMSSSLSIVPTTSQSSPVTPEDLRKVILLNHGLFIQHRAKAVEYAILAGLALRELRSSITKTEWNLFLKESGIGYNKANTYIRLSNHPEIVRDVTGGVTAAARLLARTGASRAYRHDESVRRDAADLYKQGQSPHQISQELGVTASTVSRWVDPSDDRTKKAWARLKNKKRSELLLRLEENKKIIKKNGGDLAIAYSHIRKAIEAIERVDKISYQRVNHITHQLYDVEDAVVRASKEQSG